MKFNNKLLGVLLLFGLCLGEGFADTPLDSLRRVISKTSSDTAVINTLHEMTNISLSTGNRKLTDSLLTQIANRSKAISYPRGLMLFYFNKGQQCILGGNFKRAAQYLDSLMVFPHSDTILLAKSYKSLSRVYSELYQSEKAVHYLLKGIALTENKPKYERIYVSLLIAMSGHYKSQMVYDKALIYLRQALQQANRHRFTEEVLAAHVNIANIFAETETGLFDSILHHADIAERLARSQKAMRAFPILYNAKGLAFAYKQTYDSSLYYYDKALESSAKMEESTAHIFINKARTFMAMKDTKRTSQCLLEALRLSREEESINFEADVYELMAKHDSITGNFAQALKHYKQFTILRDNLIEADNEAQIERMKSEFAFEKQELTIKEQQSAIENLRLAEAVATKHKNLLLVVLVSLLVVSFLVYRQQRTQQNLANLKLKQTQIELELNTEKLNNFTEKLILQREAAVHVYEELEALKEAQMQQNDSRLSTMDELLKSRLLTNTDWERYQQLFEKVYPQFFVKLKTTYPDLTEGDTRLLALCKLNLSAKDMANILGISPASVNTARYRLRKKFNLEPEADLNILLEKLV